jgi:FkbM family methyltransferase
MALQKTYNDLAAAVRRLPYGDQAVVAAKKHLPAPAKRLLSRTRHRMVMRSPTSMLSRAITPGVENRLLGDPAVVERLLNTERAAEIMDHRPAPSGKNVDWVAQVALNDPAGVVQTLTSLAAVHPHVDAALDRLTAGRAPLLTEEQVVDVFLSLDEFDRRRYWSNERIRSAFLTDEISSLWDISSFRASFLDALLEESDLLRLRTMLQSERLNAPGVRQSLFDELAHSQKYQLLESVGETIVIPSADLGFGKAYWADRMGELSHLDRLLALRKEANASPDQVFVDVGANIATHTVRALSSGSFSSGVAVEPDPRVLPLLKANVALNQLDKRVKVAECAAGDREGEASLWCSEVNWGDNRLSGTTGDGWQEIKVPVRTVAQILDTAGVAPTDVGVLWIDVQGHEAEVLDGASEIIGNGCDIVVEFWPSVLSNDELLDVTVNKLLSLSDRWIDLETGDLVDRLRFQEIGELGVEIGDSYSHDLALIQSKSH